MKGAIPLFALVLGLGALVMALVPGLAESVYATVTGTPTSCAISQYDINCKCSDDQNKQLYVFGVVPRYYCEDKVLAFDPDSTTFNQDVTAHAVGYLEGHVPDCDTVNCPASIEVSWVQHESGNREAYVVCNDIARERSWWEVYVDLEDGNINRFSCMNFEELVIGEMTPAQFKLICQQSANNQYVNLVIDATESSCACHEIFPYWACLSGKQCTKGVTYDYSLKKDVPDWQGCGDWASRVWAEGPP